MIKWIDTDIRHTNISTAHSQCPMVTVKMCKIYKWNNNTNRQTIAKPEDKK